MTRCGSTLLLLVILTGCGVGEGTGSTPPWAQPDTPVAPPVEAAVSASPVEPIPPYQVKLETTKGDVVIAVRPEWAPRGAKRFRDLVESGYYDDVRLFRVVPGFVVQFGMHGDPAVNKQWQDQPIEDDPVKVSNKRGYVTFATSGPNARTAQVFINLADNAQLDTMRGSFAPFAEVIEGMEVVEAFNSEYEEAPSNMQGEIAASGNEYLDATFPGLDSIVKATIVGESPSAPAVTEEAGSDVTAAEPPAEAKPAAEEPAPATTEATPETEEPAADDAAPADEPSEEPSSAPPAEDGEDAAEPESVQ